MADIVKRLQCENEHNLAFQFGKQCRQKYCVTYSATL